MWQPPKTHPASRKAKDMPSPATYTRDQLAQWCGVTVDQFDKRHRRWIRPEHQKRLKNKPRFTPEAVFDIADALIEQEREKLRLSGDDAALMMDADSDSPALERLRLARAQIAELELDEKRGDLVAMKDIQSAFRRFAGIVRRGFAALGKKHGNPAKELAERTIDAAIEAVEADLLKGDT